MSLSYQLNEQNGFLEIAISGHVGFHLVREFTAIYEQLKERPKGVKVDLTNATHIDSAGLGLFVNLKKFCGTEVESNHIYNCNASITQTLMSAKFNKLYTFHNEKID